MSRLVHLLVAVALAATATGCTDGDGDPSEGSGGEFQTIEEGAPASIEDVVQHLAETPPYPAPVTDEPEMVELRSPDVSRRHHLFLAELEEPGTLQDELIPGSVVWVADGVTLEVPEGASVAMLDGTTVAEVSNCAGPCTVTGPALVAPTDWLSGIRTAPDWELLVPAPTE